MIGHKKRVTKSERKINKNNKKLMIDKIFSYNPMLLEGIEVYKDANRNFIFLIILGSLLTSYPLISLPCCILSMFFIIKMLQFIRYKSIDNIVQKIAKDLSYKGIYDKEKTQNMLDDFIDKYGDNIIEYRELVNMLNKYETLVTKIEKILKNVSGKDMKFSDDKEKAFENEELSFLEDKGDLDCEEIQVKQYNGRKFNNYNINFNKKLSVLYKKEDGETKKVSKAIDFFEEENNESFNEGNAVILKGMNKNLTVYLYKKSPDLQKNIL